MSKAILTLNNVTKTYGKGHMAVDVLRGANLELRAGEIVALLGPSGSGKSTLLHIAGLLDSISSGELFFEKQNITQASDAYRTCLRRDHFGFVYQFHHLLPEFTALENASMPLLIAGINTAEAHARAKKLLLSLGLHERLTHHPAELSGGEQQRVAIARALINMPALLLADEPTGNLDPDTADQVFSLLIAHAKKAKSAVLCVTHNPALAKKADRIVRLKNGRIA